MRIKFQKGMTPEDMAKYFLKILRDRQSLIGAVNVYVQEYDDNLKIVKEEDGYYLVKSNESSQAKYNDYAADIRRSKLKAV